MRIVKDKASDPFETLPLELAYLILGRLEFHDIG